MTTAIIIGAGNVATHLALAMYHSGVKILAIYARKQQSAEKLANKVDAKSFTDLSLLPGNASLNIIAISDSAIELVSNKLQTNGIVVHTSGITPMSVLAKHPRRGVFYPMQSFKVNVPVKINEVPVLIEASDEEALNLLKKVANLISKQVVEVQTHERQMVHLAAVFANNFTNHLYAVAHDILQGHGLSFDMLKPLIAQTAANMQHQLPENVQTGPAARVDMDTIEMHLQLLREHLPYRQLYELISASIIEKQNNRK